MSTTLQRTNAYCYFRKCLDHGALGCRLSAIPLSITEGSITLAGPSTAAAIAAGAPSPPSCVVANNKQSITCDVATLTGGLGVGVALVQPGHTSNSICAFGPSGPISAPGCHTEQQETQIP
jgi:hypothetical protein